MTYSMNFTFALATVSALVFGTVSNTVAGTAGSDACDLKINLMEKAEMMEGGAHFKGTKDMTMTGMDMAKKPGMDMAKMTDMKKDKMPDTQMVKMTDMKMDKMPDTQMAKMPDMKMDNMAGMKGAHEIHDGQYGGTFFMAPNKTHHIEGIYSEHCGFKLVLFNAMTQPINVSRFGAFVKYIPEDEDEPEVYRILSSAHDGSVLQVPSNPKIAGEFDVELYVKFPGNDELSMFNIRVKH